VRIWHKWLERRTRGRTFTWDNVNAFLTRRPLPAAKNIHRERISHARNRMPELRTSGCVGARAQPLRLAGALRTKCGFRL
jgi:hypothetical protein